MERIKKKIEKQAEENLKISENKFRRLFESAQDAIFIIDHKKGARRPLSLIAVQYQTILKAV